MLKLFKKIFFWGYARNTWQYDVLCALIVAFIFLTPPGWFDTGATMKNWSGGEPASVGKHQKPAASTIILEVPEGSPAQIAQNDIEKRVRTITGRNDVEVLAVKQKVDGAGNVVAYEVDIR